MDKIIALLDLQKQIRNVENVSDLGFLAANKTHDLIAYKQAVFWMCDGGTVTLKKMSGMGNLDGNGPYALWLKSIISNHLKYNKEPFVYIEKKDDGEWVSEHNYVLNFRHKDGDVLGGLWIETTTPIIDNQKELLIEISENYAHALSYIHHRNRTQWLSGWTQMNKVKKIILCLCLIAFFFPVRLSVTAPAEIIADDATVVTMPYEGVLESVYVSPSDKIEDNQLIATIDKTVIQTEFDKANQALKSARAELSRAGIASLSADEKKQDLQGLRAEIAAKKIDMDFAAERLKNTDITAPQSGVAIFSDKTALEGRALQTGEKIMTIADPNNIQLLIRVPTQSMVSVQDGQDISFYLNTAPLSNNHAVITSIGYEPSADPDGLMTYKIRAVMGENVTDVRIGWQGTAKIKTDWTVLGYAMMRRPLIALRNLSGI